MPSIEFELFKALYQDNDTEKVLKILKTGNYSISAHYGTTGETLLTTAVYKENIEVVKTLIELGADLNEANCSGNTPLFIAAEKSNEEILNLLISSGADLLKGVDSYNINFFEKLSFPIKQKLSIKIISMLLDKNDLSTLNKFLEICSSDVKLNFLFDDVKDLVIKANELDNVNLLKFLCSHGKDMKPNQPLIEFIPDNYLDLLSKDNTDFLTNKRESLLEELILSQSKKNELLKNTIELHNAIAINNFNRVKELISTNNIFINNVSTDTKHTLLTNAIAHNNIKVVKLLLDAGANPNQANLRTQTPLIMVLNTNNAELLKLLLNYNLDISKSIAPTINVLASSAKVSSPQILKLLLDYDKSSINSRNYNGETPLVAAAKRNNIQNLNLLLKAGADPSVPDSTGKTFIDYISKELVPFYDNYASPQSDNISTSLEKLSLNLNSDNVHEATKTAIPPKIETIPISEADCKSKSFFDVLKLLIDSYNTPSAKFIYDYIQNPNFNYDTLFENMYFTINDVLKKLKLTNFNSDINIVVNNSDSFYIGDIHGNLPELIKSLYVAKLIDSSGNWIGKDKTLVQLGDVIHRGEYSWETVFFLKVLQLQAEYGDNKGKIVRLLGNHEEAVMRGAVMRQSNGVLNATHGEPVLKEILINDILNQKIQLSHADDKRNIISFHAGLEKGKLLQTIAQITTSQEVLNVINSILVGNNNLSDLHNILSKNNIKLSDISNYFNKDYLKFISEHSNNLENANPPYYLRDEHSIIFTRKKHTKYPRIVNDNEIPNLEKPIQIVGHSIVNLNNVAKVHNWIYADVCITEGYNSFMAFSKDNLNAFEITKKHNFWDVKNFIKLSSYLSLKELRTLKSSILSQNLVLSRKEKLSPTLTSPSIFNSYKNGCEKLDQDIRSIDITSQNLLECATNLDYKDAQIFFNEIDEFFDPSATDDLKESLNSIKKQNYKRLSFINTKSKITPKTPQKGEGYEI